MLGQERETTTLGRSSLCFSGFTFGADSISKEVARFSRGNFFVSLVSVFIVVHVILSVKILIS